MANPFAALSQMLCSHYWRGVEERRSVDDTDTMINFRDVECTKCGKKARLTREAYIKHMVETKRI